MTVKGGTSQACAACKYQRRRCSAECQLAPYFPPDQPKLFQNAHRLFGVSNILKIIKPLSPSEKMEAMKSIIYQSNVRDHYRVHGCTRVIAQLQYQIRQTRIELDAVNMQLDIFRQQFHNQPPPSSQLQLGNGEPDDVLPLFQRHPCQTFNVGESESNNSLDQISFSNGNTFGYGQGHPHYIDNKEMVMNQLWVQNPYMNNNNQIAIESQIIAEEAIPLQQLHEAPQDYDEMTTYYDTIDDDRQSHIDCKDPYESSSESSLKDTRDSIESGTQNELRNAAAALSLTNVN